eukprot:459906-Rhodomonas_salina.2
MIDNVVPLELLHWAVTKQFKAWTHGSQVPMTAEIAALQSHDKQLGCSLALLHAQVPGGLVPGSP